MDESKFIYTSLLSHCAGNINHTAVRHLLLQSSNIILSDEEALEVINRISPDKHFIDKEGILKLARKKILQLDPCLELWNQISGGRSSVDKYVFIRFIKEKIQYTSMRDTDILQMLSYVGHNDRDDITLADFRRM